VLFIAEPFREIFGQIGFAAEKIFTDPEIKPWRKLADRENCTWDISANGRTIRLHVKRFPATRAESPAKIEARGYELLRTHGIPAPEVAACGILNDGRSFIATEDLTGFTPADKLVESGFAFDRLLIPTADLAARLHNAGLHHRDLYLCHFMANADGDGVKLRMIDAARVHELPGIFTRQRWIVKDLSQFWYSTTQLPISERQREAWLAEYAERTKVTNLSRLRSAVARKSDAIGKHDQRIRVREPGRNISIPK
jgi:hypothetical protein